MDAERSPREVVKLVRRRLPLVVALALSAMMVGSVVSLLLPKAFSSETQLEVGSVGGLNGTEYLNRVNAASDQIRSHDALAEVCTKLGLDTAFVSLDEAVGNEKRELLLQELRARTAVDVKPQSDSAYLVTISHKSADPDLTVRVVSALAEYYQRLAFDGPTEAQAKTVLHLSKSEKETGAAHERAAAEALAYRKANSEFLDGASAHLEETREQIKQIEQVELAGLEKRKRGLEELLSKEPREVVAKVRQLDSVKVKVVEDKLRDINETLSRMIVVEKKTEAHAEVIAQRELIRKLDAEKQKLVDESPVVEDRQPNEQWVALDKERREVSGQADTCHLKLRRLRDQERDQRELAKRTPEIEAKARQLDEARTATKSAWDTSTAALAKAESELAVMRDKGTLQIRPVGAPVRPGSPAGPGALMLALAGLVAGALLGVGLAFTVGAMDRSFRDVDAVSQFLGVPTMGAIHLIQTPMESALRRRARRRKTAGIAVLAVFAAAVLAVALLGDVSMIRDFVKSVLG